MDLFTNYFITCNVNYVYNYKKFAKGVVVFKIALTIAAMGRRDLSIRFRNKLGL